MRLRHAVAAALIAAATSAAVASLPQTGRLEGLSLDTLFYLRYEAFGQLHPRDSSPSVVVALEGEPYRTPPFADKPSAFWTPQIGKVLTAVVEGGATVVG